jgi:outer membrane protein assembly factor BamB
MKSRVLVSSLVLSLFGLCAGLINAEDFDWPRWRGPNGDGISIDTDWNPEALKNSPKIIWRVDIGRSHSNIAVKGKYLYAIGNEYKVDTVYCLKAKNGKTVWKYSYESSFDPPQATPTVDEDSVYVLSKTGTLFSFNAENGKVQWMRDLVKEYETERIPYGYSGSPVIVGDLIILNVNTAGIALNKKTGDLVWVSPVHSEKRNTHGYHATPVIYKYNGKDYALILSGTGLFSIEVATGKILWYFECLWSDIPNIADPELYENKVFLRFNSHIDNNLSKCLVIDTSGKEPRVLWENKNLRNDIGTCVLFDGYLYGSDDVFSGLLLRCVDFKTGEVMWEENKMNSTLSLIVADGKLIILDENGTLYIAEATPLSYKEISSGDVLDDEIKLRKFWTSPVLCNGKIYCRNWYGDIVCIDVRK